MRNLIVLLLVVGLVGGGIYVWKFKGKELKDLADEAKGYPPAKTPQEAVDNFTKAIKDRNYNMAAKYCTAKYAEELTRANEAANKLGTAIDNLNYQMNERAVSNDTMRLVLLSFDPFPKDFGIAINNEKETEAAAVLEFTFRSDTAFPDWKIDPSFRLALLQPLFGKNYTAKLRVKMTKEGEVWKFDFKDNEDLQMRVARLNDRASYYAQVLSKISGELKTDAETQSGFQARLKNLLEDAAKSTK